MKDVTIAVRGSTDVSQVSLDHNFDKDMRNREEHVDPNKKIIILEHKSLKKVYDESFGDSVDEYNEKQKRKDRRIRNYLQDITKAYNEEQEKVKEYNEKHPAEKKKFAKKAPPAREIIIGVYQSDLTENEKVELLTKFYNGFKDRNPNMAIVGAVIHPDEMGDVHMHLDYVPLSKSNKRGLQVQNSMSGALRDQGFTDIDENGIKKRGYALTQWNEREREALEELCHSYGYNVIHPDRETGRQHMNTPEYKKWQTDKENLEKEKELFNNAKELISTTFQNLSEELNTKSEKLDTREETIQTQEKQVKEKLKKASEEAENIIEQAKEQANNQVTEINEHIKQLKKQEEELEQDIKEKQEKAKNIMDIANTYHSERTEGILNKAVIPIRNSVGKVTELKRYKDYVADLDEKAKNRIWGDKNNGNNGRIRGDGSNGNNGRIWGDGSNGRITSKTGNTQNVTKDRRDNTFDKGF